MGAASFAAGLLKLLCSADQWKDDDGKFRGKKIPDLFTYEQNHPVGVQSQAAESIGDAFFLAQYTSKDAAASDMVSAKINKAFNEVCR